MAWLSREANLGGFERNTTYQDWRYKAAGLIVPHALARQGKKRPCGGVMPPVLFALPGQENRIG